MEVVTWGGSGRMKRKVRQITKGKEEEENEGRRKMGNLNTRKDNRKEGAGGKRSEDER